MTACTEVEFEHPEGDLAGSWFGVRRDGANAVLWQSWKGPDGSIEISFITCRRGELVQSEHQVGSWEYQHGVYRTLIEKWYIGDEEYFPEDGAEAVDHEYRVLELDDEHIVYRHRSTRKTYEMRRTDEFFELGCDKIPRHEPRVRVVTPGELDARIVRQQVEASPGVPAGEEPGSKQQESSVDAESVAGPE